MQDASSPFSRRIFLVRHGETAWSREKKHTGLTDLPLTPEGEEQAKRTKELLQLPFREVYTSPLLRARQTCALAGFADRAKILSSLVEWDYGDYEGKTTKEIRTEHPDWNLFDDGPPGGETLQEISLRADSAISEACNVQGDVLLFLSGHIARVLAARWIGLSGRCGKHLTLGTASVSILGYEHEWRCISLWNRNPL